MFSADSPSGESREQTAFTGLKELAMVSEYLAYYSDGCSRINERCNRAGFGAIEAKSAPLPNNIT
jgi:hypothetical protein